MTGRDANALIARLCEARGHDEFLPLARQLVATCEAEIGGDVTADGMAVTTIADVSAEPVEWLWPHRVPLAGLTLVIGDPGLDKSTLTCDLAAKVSRGDLGAASDVFMVTAEDSISAVVRPRLEAAGAALGRVHVVAMRRDGIEEGIALPDDVAELENQVERHSARLVVIDPLMAHLPESVNSWRDQSVRGALAPLHRLAERQRCAVVVVGHLNKARGDKAIYRAGGSIGILGAARSALLMAADPDDPEGERGSRRVLAQVKTNYGKPASSLAYEVRSIVLPGPPRIETVAVAERGESRYGSVELLATPDAQVRDERDEAVEFLKVELGDGPRPAREIKAAAADAGISEITLKRAKGELAVVSEKDGLAGGWVWRLPKENPLEGDHPGIPQ